MAYVIDSHKCGCVYLRCIYILKFHIIKIVKIIPNIFKLYKPFRIDYQFPVI